MGACFGSTQIILCECMRLVMYDSVAHQAPLFMEFSQQEYWSGLPFPSPGDFPDPRIKPWSPALQVDSLQSEPPGKPIKVTNCLKNQVGF